MKMEGRSGGDKDAKVLAGNGEHLCGLFYMAK
jgi:hypothetical protein